MTIDADDRALVVHEDAAGHRPSATFAPDRDQTSPSFEGEQAAIVFDFDGDGDPELFFTLRSRGYEDRIVRRVFVTARGGAIVPCRAAPRGALLARLRAECAPRAAESARCEGPCRHLGRLEAGARLDPPTRLSE